jgi:Tol biopolymer transport system component
MKPRAISILCFALALAAASVVATAEDRKANVLLQSGNAKVTLQGDLKGAIADYKNALKEATSQAVKARVLIRLGDAYQRLGEQEARSVFEQIVREFADQKEIASEAKNRLASLAPGPSKVISITRREFKLNGSNGNTCDYSISADGHYALCSDGVRDLATRDLVRSFEQIDPALGRDQGGVYHAFDSGSLSRDGKKVVYTVFKLARESRVESYELRTVSLSDPNPQPKRLYENPNVEYLSAHDWTPDGKQLVVVLTLKDKTTQIGLVSVPEGRLQVLRSVDWRGPSQVFVTPDGRQLAYDLPANDTTRQRDVFVLAVDGSGREERVVNETTNDVVMGWSPDSKQLIFASESGEEINLRAVPIALGKSDGVSRLLALDIGSTESLGVTNSGALYLVARARSQPRIRIAAFDFNTEQFIAPAGMPSELIGSDPRWSPDGRYLLYRGKQASLTVRAVESGQIVREVIPALSSFSPLGWTSDGKAFFVGGRDFKGRKAIYRVDQDTNDVSAVPGTDCECAQLSLSPDGTKLYSRQRSSQDPLVVRDLLSGKESELPISGFGTAVSPDGKYVVASTGAGVLSLLPSEGGSVRELYRGFWPAWAPDGRSILVSNASGIWRVSLDGQAHKLDFSGFLSAVDFGALGLRSGFNISPKGLIAIQDVGNASPASIRVIENFLSGNDSPTPAGTIPATRNTEDYQIAWLDRTGKVVERIGPKGRYRDLALSPDGKRIAVSGQDSSGYDLWILESGQSTLTRLTNGASSGEENRYPVWSPDGKKIAFVSTQAGKSRLHLKDATGNGADEILVDSQILMRDLSWSADGRFLVYGVTGDSRTGDDIWAIPMTGDRKSFAVVQTLSNEHLAQISPDGKWIAYVSQRNLANGGGPDTFVRPFPDGPSEIRISTPAPAVYPRWGSDGKELFFVGLGNGSLMQVGISAPPLVLNAPRLLIAGNIFGDLRWPYAISPDGQRILVLLPASSTAR